MSISAFLSPSPKNAKLDDEDWSSPDSGIGSPSERLETSLDEKIDEVFEEEIKRIRKFKETPSYEELSSSEDEHGDDFAKIAPKGKRKSSLQAPIMINEALSEYEKIRNDNIKERESMLAQLMSDIKDYKQEAGMAPKPVAKKGKGKGGLKRKKGTEDESFETGANIPSTRRRSSRLSLQDKKETLGSIEWMTPEKEKRKFVPKRRVSRNLIDAEDLDGSQIKLSNDMADACKTHCKLCNDEVKLVAMRGHTKSKHKMTITEYKSKFGVEFEIIEKIHHECGICKKIILLCSDTVAVHLKTPGHGITHKNYNEKYMHKAIKYNEEV